jgi:hypothetical protein
MAGFSPRACPTSTWTGWTSSSRRPCCRDTPRGVCRRGNAEYDRVKHALARARQRGDHAAARALRKQLRGLPVQDPSDPGYRRLRYVRYADDILLGFIGPKAEAEEIKRRLGQFLHEDLRLGLSETKTLITHARTEAARFLGYEITTQHANHVITGGRRAANGAIGLRVPRDVIKTKCSRYMQRGKPERRPGLMNDEDHAIISRYGSEYRGDRPVLPARRRRGSAEPAALGDADLPTEDAGRQVRLVGIEDGPQICGDRRDAARAVQVHEVTVDRGEDKKPLVATFGGIPLRRQKNGSPLDLGVTYR